jgi:ribonuclease P protein component
VKEVQSLTAKIHFDLVYATGRSWAGKETVLRALPNNLPASRFGFVVSKRIGKAVVRNKVRRRLREIVRQLPVKPGWDIVLIARIPAVGAAFGDISQSVGKLLLRAGLLVEKDESCSPGVN